MTNLFLISMTIHLNSVTIDLSSMIIDLNLMTIDLNLMTTHLNQLLLTEFRNECKIVFGGDCFDQFASDFDDHSSKSVAI